MTPGTIQYDERGLPYLLQGDGSRYYLSPRSMDPTATPPHGGGFWRGQDRWNQKTGNWEKGGLNGGNILSAIVGAGLGAGALSAAGVFGGAGASGAGAGGAVTGPTFAVGPAGTIAGWAGGGAGAGGAAIGAAGSGLGSGLGSKILNAAVPFGLTGAARAVGSGQGSIPPQLQQILDLQKQRMQLQTPLFEAISRLAMSRLPIAQQQPMPGGPGVDPLAALQRLTGGR